MLIFGLFVCVWRVCLGIRTWCVIRVHEVNVLTLVDVGCGFGVKVQCTVEHEIRILYSSQGHPTPEQKSIGCKVQTRTKEKRISANQSFASLTPTTKKKKAKNRTPRLPNIRNCNIKRKNPDARGKKQNVETKKEELRTLWLPDPSNQNSNEPGMFERCFIE
jgi:hypothetical protein